MAGKPAASITRALIALNEPGTNSVGPCAISSLSCVVAFFMRLVFPSVDFCTGILHDLRPQLLLISDKPPQLLGRARYRLGALPGELLAHRREREGARGRAVQRDDDLLRRLRRRDQAV